MIDLYIKESLGRDEVTTSGCNINHGYMILEYDDQSYLTAFYSLDPLYVPPF